MKFNRIAQKITFLLTFFIFKNVVMAGNPPVYFNHLYFVFDKESYHQIINSEFIKNEFGNFRVRTTTADNGKTWTGAYLFGEKNYFEIFTEAENYPLNKSGIAFGVEEPNASEIYFQKLQAIFPNQTNKVLRTRLINNQETPWFYSINVDFKDEKAILFPWLMEYHQDVLQQIYPDLKPEESGITRQKYLARLFNPKRLFQDISEITLALNQIESNRFVKLLTAYNYKIQKSREKIIAHCPDIKFFILPAQNANGILELKINLMRKKKGQKEYRFGRNSILKFKDKTAIWTFQTNG